MLEARIRSPVGWQGPARSTREAPLSPAIPAATHRARPARRADWPELCRLAVRVLDGAWSESLVRSALERPGAVGWLAGGEDGVPAVGLLLAEASLGELHVLTVGVEAQSRRRGIGGALVEAAVRHAWSRSLDRIHLEVRASNQAARALYAAHGFVVVGRRPRYYRNAEDAVLMTLERPEPTS